MAEKKPEAAHAKAHVKAGQEGDAGAPIAVIRIRGSAGVNPKIAETLRLLRLHKSNHLVLIKPEMRKMADKAKDYATYGEIDEKTAEALIEKRGLAEGNKRLTPEVLKELKIAGIAELAKEVYSGKRRLVDMGLEPVFRLRPPRKGHERGGIKKSYRMGGALGYRGKEINELIMRMI